MWAVVCRLAEEEDRPMRRYALRDDQWERIERLPPGREGYVGVTAEDNRLFVEAVLYRCAPGPWRRDPRAAPRRARAEPTGSPYVFVSERKAPLTVDAFRKLSTRIGQAAEMPLPVHPQHAETRVRLQARQPRRGHARLAGLARAAEHPAHGTVHRADVEAVQKFFR